VTGQGEADCASDAARLHFWQMSHTLTVRLTPEQAAWLDRMAQETGRARSEIIREQIEKARSAPAARRFMRIAGTISGPRDLSSRKGFSRP